MQGEMKQLQAIVASQVQQKQESSSQMGQVVSALRESLQVYDHIFPGRLEGAFEDNNLF